MATVRDGLGQEIDAVDQYMSLINAPTPKKQIRLVHSTTGQTVEGATPGAANLAAQATLFGFPAWQVAAGGVGLAALAWYFLKGKR